MRRRVQCVYKIESLPWRMAMMFRFLTDHKELFYTTDEGRIVEVKQATSREDYPFRILSLTVTGGSMHVYSNVDLQNLRVVKTPGMVVAATVRLPPNPPRSFWDHAARNISYYLSGRQAFCIDDTRGILSFFEHPQIAVTINKVHAKGTSALAACPHLILTYDVFDVCSNDATLQSLRTKDRGDAVESTPIPRNIHTVGSQDWDWHNSWVCDVVQAALQGREQFSINGDLLRFYRRESRDLAPVAPVRARLDSEITALKRELSSLLMRTADLM